MQKTFKNVKNAKKTQKRKITKNARKRKKWSLDFAIALVMNK